MDPAETLAMWRRLLALERAAGKAQFESERARFTLGERETRGVATGGLVLVESGAGALGRVAWTLGAKNGSEIAVAARPGDPVRVSRRRDESVHAQGLVTRRTRRQLVVAFDDPPEEALEEGELVVEREWDETTHERLLAGLAALEAAKGRGAVWREIVLGVRPPAAGRAQPTADAALNDAQREALARACGAEDVFLVHGPPGTGKTQVLAAVAVAEIARGGSVLAVAASNAAVDHLVTRLVARGLDPVRLGHPARVQEEVQERTLEARAERHEKARISEQLTREARELVRRADRAAKQGRSTDRYAEARAARADARRLFGEARRFARAAEDEIVERARVVAGTLTGLTSDRLRGRRFTLALIDEATQATLPATVLALLHADRAVLAGDQHQLPPTILSPEAARQGLARTLYERLLEHAPITRMLEVQHRMHETVMRYPSDALYAGRLVAHPSVAGHVLAGIEGVAATEETGAALLFVDSAGKGWNEERPEGSESLRNPGEAARIVREVALLKAAGLASRDIAIIAPYAAQVHLLRTLLPDDALEVDTVDAFQGREKEAVLVSLVRSNDAGELGFCADVRRMNVAWTRARRRLFVVGDSATVGPHSFYAGFIAHAQAAGAYRSAWEESEE